MTRRYVLILRGTMRQVAAQLKLAADKAPDMTIGELLKLQEAQIRELICANS